MITYSITVSAPRGSVFALYEKVTSWPV